jgi:uncharacterized protein (TIGR03089 family)
MTSYAQALGALRDPARPYLTQLEPDFRTELSVATFTNGVAKAANALAAELDCGPGSQIAMRLPWHWQRAIWSAAAWWIGACVCTSPDASDVDLVIADAASAVPDAVVVSLHPLGLAGDVPDGCLDGTSLARMQPDAFLEDPAAPDGIALRCADQEFDQAALITRINDLPPTGARTAILPSAGLLAWIAPVWLPVLRPTSVVMVGDKVSATALDDEAVTGSVDG